MLTNATYADLLRPHSSKYAGLYDVLLTVAGSAVIALCAQLRIFLPFSPVPITGQTFAVLMIGALLGARRGCLAALLYLFEGAMGLPVFALGGGWPILAGPTGGYLLGFVPAAYITGVLAQNRWDRRIGTTILAMLAGNVVIYSFGLLRLSLTVGLNKSLLSAGLYPFIPGDLLKIALAAILLPSGWRLLRQTDALSRID